jgi:tRNA(fMet)-specific endonuclease VapC
MKECLLDTDVLSFYLKGIEAVRKNVEEYLFSGNFDQLTFSEITYYEVKAGLEYKQAKKQLSKFEDFTSRCKIVKLTKSSLDISANRYGQLRRKGVEIGTPDLLIAGIAIGNDLVLVTNNIKHYKSIEGLQLVNWMG